VQDIARLLARTDIEYSDFVISLKFFLKHMKDAHIDDVVVDRNFFKS